MEFHLLILTPTRRYFDGNIDLLTVSTALGELTILANHQDMIANIEISKLVIRSRGNSQLFAVGGGVITVSKNIVKLLVNSIEAHDEIDIKRAIADKKEAERLKEVATSERQYREAEIKLKKALNRISIGSEKE
jgi:F-type H+-transporting ATPase subunit epsilon